VLSSWRSVGAGARLAKSAGTSGLQEAEAFYTGPGVASLIGVRGVSTAEAPRLTLSAARAIVDSLAKSLDSQELQGAKNRAIRDVVECMGSSRDGVTGSALLAVNNTTTSVAALIAEIQALTAADVSAASKKLQASPISQAAVGNVAGL